jgi:hypothetical protein
MRLPSEQGSPFLTEQNLGLQVERIETLGEPTVDRSKKVAGLISLALIAPKLCHPYRRAQFPRLCLLPTRNPERALKIRFRLCRIRLGREQRDFAGHAMDSSTDAEGVKATMRGIRRTFRTARVKKAPAIAAKVRNVVALALDGLTGLRDRALLLIGFACAFCRSELVPLDVADIEETESALLVTIRQGKTDQDGAGDVIASPAVTWPAACGSVGCQYLQGLSARA